MYTILEDFFNEVFRKLVFHICNQIGELRNRNVHSSKYLNVKNCL